MTCPENVGNRISEDLNFKILLGRMPRTRKSRYYNPRQKSWNACPLLQHLSGKYIS